MIEFFTKDKDGETVLNSNGIIRKVTFATIDEVEYFYQYPTYDEATKGIKVLRRLVSEINDPEQE